jgi:4-hydroxy-tetrahydrodipicolinate reductase
MLRTALAGYGSMGKMIEELAELEALEIVKKYDVNNKLTNEKDFDFAIAIEFTTPDSVVDNIKILAENGINTVAGTTGWYDELDDVKDIIKHNGTGLIYGTNFSIGMQMFQRIIAYAAELANNFEEYDAMLHEMHHKRKKDSPSGSAVTLAEILLSKLNSKTKLQPETQHSRIEPGDLHVSSTRGGEITGTHTVYFDSLADTIELTHRARNRKGFALGAIKAAKFIDGKKGVFDFSEVFEKEMI